MMRGFKRISGLLLLSTRFSLLVQLNLVVHQCEPIIYIVSSFDQRRFEAVWRLHANRIHNPVANWAKLKLTRVAHIKQRPILRIKQHQYFILWLQKLWFFFRSNLGFEKRFFVFSSHIDENGIDSIAQWVHISARRRVNPAISAAATSTAARRTEKLCAHI